MSWTQVTTTRRYTKVERKAFRARQLRRRREWRVQIELNGVWHDIPAMSVRMVP